ncbi:MAG TPA: histidine kinase N-terminal 7TM domain-containing protein [Mycobacteriales bacterium]
MQWHPAVVPLGISVIVAVIVGAVAARRRTSSPAAPSLVLMMSGLSLWSTADLLERTSVSLAAHLFWGHVLYLGVVVAPVGFFMLALEMTGRGDRLTRRVRLLLSVQPVLVLLIVVTDRWHGLFMSHPVLVGHHPTELQWDRGPLFWAHTAYSYAILGGGMFMLIGAWARSARAYRRQLRSIVLAASVPWLANIGTQFRIVHVGTLDLTPIAFTVTGVVLAWSLFRQRLLDLVPVARERVIDTMSDAVVVVDPQGRVADANPAAVALLDRAGRQRGAGTVGADAAEVFAGWAGVLPLRGDAQLEVQVGAGAGVVDVRVTELTDRADRPGGHLLVLRDVTRSRQAERALARANTALREQLQTIERLRAELQEQAVRDSLTGLFNRRYLDETLTRELARATREDYPVSIALLDVDHFKVLNDTHGHAAGDRMLAAIGHLLAGRVRGGDVACRYGGEELLVVLPRTTGAAATARAEEWRTACAALTVDGLGITVSIGVAAAPANGTDPAALLAAADRALYTAKRTGRDRVVAAGTQPAAAR